MVHCARRIQMMRWLVCSAASSMLEAIDHIGLAVRDIEESIAFYEVQS
jgi:hypothetical protein